MRRLLVVANQTLGGEQLIEATRMRIAAGPATFFVLVPYARAEEVGAVAVGEGWAMTTPDVDRREEEARHRAELTTQSRIQALLQQIRAAGGIAEGDVGASDPLAAIESVVRDRQFDEISISTLPTSVSRWLRRDVPSRIKRRFGLPVTTVTARS